MIHFQSLAAEWNFVWVAKKEGCEVLSISRGGIGISLFPQSDLALGYSAPVELQETLNSDSLMVAQSGDYCGFSEEVGVTGDENV